MVWNQYNLISRRPEQQLRKNCKEINRCFSLSNLTIFQDHCTLNVVLVPTLLLSLSEKDREIFDSSLPSPSVQVVRKQQLAAALSEVLNTLLQLVLCWFFLSMKTNPFQTLSSGTHSVCSSSNIHGRKCVSGKALVCVHLETEQAWLRCTYSSVPLAAVLVQHQLCSHADGPSPGFSPASNSDSTRIRIAQMHTC